MQNYIFFLEETIVDFIHSISWYTMRKEKRGSKQWPSHSLLQVATLARARATQLHLKRNYTHTQKQIVRKST